MNPKAQVRYLNGTWEVTEKDGCKYYYAGLCAEDNIFHLHPSVWDAMPTARRNPVLFDCAEHAPHFRKVIQFRDGSWHRLMYDGTWAAKSCKAALHGALIIHCLNLRRCHFNAMLAYLKEHPD